MRGIRVSCRSCADRRHRFSTASQHAHRTKSTNAMLSRSIVGLCCSNQRNDANIILMRMKESPDMWTQAGTILENSQSQHTRFIGLQVCRWRFEKISVPTAKHDLEEHAGGENENVAFCACLFPRNVSLSATHVLEEWLTSCREESKLSVLMIFFRRLFVHISTSERVCLP